MASQKHVLEVKLKALEQELQSLRKTLLLHHKGKQRPVSLEGIWKGMDISEKDIEEAKTTLFSSRY